MSDLAPQSQPTTAPAAAPSPTAPSDTSTQTTAPDGRVHTALGETAAPEPAAPATEPAAPEAAPTTPFDVTKLSFPEGSSPPDEATLNKFGEIAKSLNLSQEGAQQLVELHGQVAKNAAEQNTALWKTTIDGWTADIRKNPKYGSPTGDSPLNEAARAKIGSLLNRFGGPGVLAAFDLTGFGSHPDGVDFVYQLADAFAEGGMVRGDAPGTPKENPGAARALFPNLPSAAGD